MIHLHLHSQFSLLDGAIKIKSIPSRLKELEMGACAITDSGNLFGAIEFHNSMKKKGLNPIIGLETQVAIGDRFKKDYGKNQKFSDSLILLCQNKEGYHNLVKLASMADREGKYLGVPRLDDELLEKHNKGIIALSACLNGDISRLLNESPEQAKERAIWYAQVFDGRYYLEVQNNGVAGQSNAVDKILKLSKETSIPLVGTNACRYMNSEDAEAQHILKLMGMQKKVTDYDAPKMETSEIYLKSSEEMEEAFKDLPAECLLNTNKIAEQCEIDLTNKKYFLPDYPTTGSNTLEEELIQEAYKGLEDRKVELTHLNNWENIEKDIKPYKARIEYETGIINKMGFPGYFLIVADFVQWGKDNGVPVGPGRGSGAGSIVAYCLKITDIDPLKYDLLFERFLNPERVSMPDFDIDFETEGREKVINYVRKKYGDEKVCQISAIGSLQAKGAIRGVARVLNMPYSDADKISKLVPNELKMTIASALDKSPELKEIAVNGSDLEKKIIRISLALEGLNSNLSTHAAGVIIMNSDITDVMPTCTPSSAGAGIQSMYTMEHAESQGAVKFDFLGLRNLTIIDKAVKLINENSSSKEDLNLSLIPLDDEETFKLLSKGDTTGVFQMESSGMKALLQKMKPNCFEDIIALVALYRPGPLGSGMVDTYVDCKHGRKEITYPHPKLEPVLKETNGVMVYQEQVMRAVQVLADFSLGEADLLRRAIGKKKAEILLEQRGLFVKGCEKNDIDKNTANYIFDLIDKFAGYGFNKSHSAAYGLIGYQTAWLKANYPVEYMAALLTTDISRPDSIVKLIRECKEMGIEVLPPGIKEGELHFTTNGTKIRFGLNAIKNVGSAALENIIEARNRNGGFKNLVDVFTNINASKVSTRVLEALVKSGAFDTLIENRKQLLGGLPKAIELAQAERDFNKSENQVSMFDMMDQTEVSKSDPTLEFPEEEDWNLKMRLNYEKEALGFYVSGHPLDPYQEELKLIGRLITTNKLKSDNSGLKNGNRVSMVAIISENITKMTKKNDRFSILTVEDVWGNIEVVAFPKSWELYNHLFETEEPLLIEGKVNIQEDNVNIIADKFQTMTSIRAERADLLEFSVETEKQLEKIKLLDELFQQYPGNCKTGVSIKTKNAATVKVELNKKVAVTGPFIKSLEEAFPSGGFSFSYRKD